MSNIESIAVKSLRALKVMEIKIIALERTFKKAKPELYKEYMAEFENVKNEHLQELKEIERIIKTF